MGCLPTYERVAKRNFAQSYENDTNKNFFVELWQAFEYKRNLFKPVHFEETDSTFHIWYGLKLRHHMINMLVI